MEIERAKIEYGKSDYVNPTFAILNKYNILSKMKGNEGTGGGGNIFVNSIHESNVLSVKLL